MLHGGGGAAGGGLYDDDGGGDGAGGYGGGYDYEDGDSHDGGSAMSPSRRGLGGGGGVGSADEAAKNFKVVIRVRPPLPRELHGDRPFQNVVQVDGSERVIVISENLSALEEGATTASPYSTHVFTFDHVYDQHCGQRKVYETTAQSVVESSLAGYNATIFAVSPAPASPRGREGGRVEGGMIGLHTTQPITRSPPVARSTVK